VAALVLFAAACDEPPEPAASPPADAIRWHPLGTWSGRGDRQTESFDVVSGTLKLAWETSNERTPGAGRLRVSLYSSISGRPLQTIVDTTGTGVDSAYVADEPRVSYLLIESDGVDWRLRLEEAVRGGR
jgi:hypothetical protein